MKNFLFIRPVTVFMAIVTLFSSSLAISAGAPMSSKNARSLVVNALMGFRDPMTFDTGIRDWANYQTTVQAAIAPTTYQGREGFDPASGSVRHFEMVTQQFGASRIPDNTAADLFRAPPPLRMNQIVEEWKFWKAYREYLAATWTAPACCSDPDFPCYAGCTYAAGETDFLYTTTCPNYGALFFQWMNSGCTSSPSLAGQYISDEVKAFLESDLSKTEENLIKFTWMNHMVKKGVAWQYISDVLRYMDVNGIESAWVDLAQDVVLGRQKAHPDLTYIPAQTEANGTIYRVQGSWLLSRSMVNTINSPAALAGNNNSFTGSTVYPIAPRAATPPPPALDTTIIEVFYANGNNAALTDLAHSWQKSINQDTSCDGLEKQRNGDQLDCIDKSHNWSDPKDTSPTPNIVDNGFINYVWPKKVTANDTFGRLYTGLGMTPNPGVHDPNLPQGRLYVIAHNAKDGSPVDLQTFVAASAGAGGTWTIPAAAAANGVKNIAYLTLSANPLENSKKYNERKTGALWNKDDDTWSVGTNVPTQNESIRPYQDSGTDNQEMQGTAFLGQYPAALLNSPVKTRASRNMRAVECLINKNFNSVKVDPANPTGQSSTSTNAICDRSMRDLNDLMSFFKAGRAYIHYVGRWEPVAANAASYDATPLAEADILQRYAKYNLCQSPYYDSIVQARYNMVRPVYRFKAEKTSGNISITPGRILVNTRGDDVGIGNTWSSVTGLSNPYQSSQATFDDYGLISATGRAGSFAYSGITGPKHLGPITYFKRWRFDRNSDMEQMIKGLYQVSGQNFGFPFVDFRAASEEFDRPALTLLTDSGQDGRVDWVRPIATTLKSSWLAGTPGTVLKSGFSPEIPLLSGFTYPTSGGVDYLGGPIQSISADTEEKQEILFGCAEMNLGLDLTPWKNQAPAAGTCTVTGATPPSDPYTCGGVTSQAPAACGSQAFLINPATGTNVFTTDGFISTVIPNAAPFTQTGTRAGTAIVSDTPLVHANLPAAADGGYLDGKNSGFPRADLNFYIKDWEAKTGKYSVTTALGNHLDSNLRYTIDRTAHACGIAYQKNRYWAGQLSCSEVLPATVPKTWSCVVPINSLPNSSFANACALPSQVWYEDSAPGLESECEEYCASPGSKKICDKRYSAWGSNSPAYLKQPECSDSTGKPVFNAGSLPVDATDAMTPLSVFSNRCMSPEVYNSLKGNGKW